MIDYLCTPERFDTNELAREGVKIIDKEKGTCKCITCGQVWTVDEVAEQSDLPDDFWQCPIGCNVLSLHVRSAGPNWVLWELPDATPILGTMQKDEKIELYELQPVTDSEQIEKLLDFAEEEADPFVKSLDWDIHEYMDGSVFVANTYENEIYSLKPARVGIWKLYEKEKGRQFNVAGILGNRT